MKYTKCKRMRLHDYYLFEHKNILFSKYFFGQPTDLY